MRKGRRLRAVGWRRGRLVLVLGSKNQEQGAALVLLFKGRGRLGEEDGDGYEGSERELQSGRWKGEYAAVVVWRLALGLFGWRQGNRVQESSGRLREGRGLPWAATAFFFVKRGWTASWLERDGFRVLWLP
jgi:hypothetical protein